MLTKIISTPLQEWEKTGLKIPENLGGGFIYAPDKHQDGYDFIEYIFDKCVRGESNKEGEMIYAMGSHNHKFYNYKVMYDAEKREYTTEWKNDGLVRKFIVSEKSARAYIKMLRGIDIPFPLVRGMDLSNKGKMASLDRMKNFLIHYLNIAIVSSRMQPPFILTADFTPEETFERYRKEGFIFFPVSPRYDFDIEADAFIKISQ